MMKALAERPNDGAFSMGTFFVDRAVQAFGHHAPLHGQQINGVGLRRGHSWIPQLALQ